MQKITRENKYAKHLPELKNGNHILIMHEERWRIRNAKVLCFHINFNRT